MKFTQEELVEHFRAAIIDTNIRLRCLYTKDYDKSVFTIGFLLGYQSACETALELMGEDFE